MSTPTDRYGWYVDDALKWRHKPTEEKFTHTPGWPNGSDPTQVGPCQSVTVSVKMTCYGNGITRKEAEALAIRFEEIVKRKLRRKDTLRVSAIV
jgi:hypothetical protein